MEHHSLDTELGKENPLFAAIMYRDEKQIKTLTGHGETFSEELRAALVNGCRSLLANRPESEFMLNYIADLGSMSAEEFLFVIPKLREKAGAPLYFTNSLLNGMFAYKGFWELLFNAAVLECFLNCFDLKKVNKKRMMTDFIKENRADLLALFAEHGWLGTVKMCDEMTELANNAQSTECAAFLLDHKNKSFDLAAERLKADKKSERELNAAPGSVTALKLLWSWKKREDGTLVITGYKGGQTEITVPERIGKSVVTAIGDWAFSPWGRGFPEERKSVLEAITKITLPSTIKHIGKYAFWRISALEKINIPNGVTVIENGAFDTCFKLPKINLPASVTAIGEGAFNCCSDLVRVIIPEGITRIENNTFGYCSALSSVEIPDTVQSIGERAFTRCKSLEAVTVPSGVAEISASMFSGCEKLERVDLPEMVVKIGRFAFARCAALKETVIPEGVREIGEMAFSECTALERIVLPASLEKAKNLTTQKGEVPRTIFDNSPNVTAVITPKSYAEGYCKRNNIPFVYKEAAAH